MSENVIPITKLVNATQYNPELYELLTDILHALPAELGGVWVRHKWLNTEKPFPLVNADDEVFINQFEYVEEND